MMTWKPLSITVNITSRMIVPPTRPKEGDFVTYAANTAVAGGAVMENSAGRRYWAASGGTTAAGGTEPVHTDGDVTDGTVVWRFLRPRRTRLDITNKSAAGNNIFLAFDQTAVAQKGVWLATGDTATFEGSEVPRGAVNAVADGTAADNLVLVQES